MRKTIATAKAPAAIGPYSQAVNLNGTVFVSGQLPVILPTERFPPVLNSRPARLWIT